MYYNKQVGDFDCGAASAATVFGIPYAEAFNICKTDKKGTYSQDVFCAAKSLNNDSIFLSALGELKNLWWIPIVSRKHPIYLGLSIKKQISKRGRPTLAHHAVSVINGKIYDPAQKHGMDLDIFCGKYKSCAVNSIIIFGKELDTYGKNS